MISNFKEIWTELKKYPNVNGISEEYMPKIIGGETHEETPCIRVYVRHKVARNLLHPKYLIPMIVDGVQTDVVEIGVVRALRTRRHRPLVKGVSMGHWNISAGTLGGFFHDDDGNIYIGTNAHVGTQDAMLTHEEQKNGDTRWIQPGRYDGGGENDVIGHYYWHQQLFPVNYEPDCNIADRVVKFLNGVAEAFGRTTRVEKVADIENTIDFAVGTISTCDGFVNEFIDDVRPREHNFVGLFFAGSSETSIGCRGSELAKYGFYPCGYDIVEPEWGMRVVKSGRTTGFTESTINDTSATIRVGFAFGVVVEFSHVFLTRISMLQGGDSGSFALTRKPAARSTTDD